MTLTELLSLQQIVLIDGAMGTELANMGLDIGLPLWSANALLKAPHVVRSIHAEYLRAGADIITTNTFRTNQRAMRKAGREEKWDLLNRVAVELAFEARERYPIFRPILIAGSMAPGEDCYCPALVPSEHELAEEHGEQAALLASLGVDVLLGETLITVRESAAVARACAATGKEFAVSFFCKDDTYLLSGEPLKEAVEAVAPFHPTAVMINCVSYQSIHEPLSTLASAWNGVFGCYANTGDPLHDVEDSLYEQKLFEFADYAKTWTAAGARIVGGCCGTTPDHIFAIAKTLNLRQQKKS